MLNHSSAVFRHGRRKSTKVMKEAKDIVFIKNTLEVLKQYDQFKGELGQSYARTLFINACIGLLFIPRSNSIYDKLPDEIVSKEKWGIDADDIKICTPKRTVKQVARHLRNSIGHNCFEYDCPLCVSKPIEEISFKDLSPNSQLTFQATLKFKDFSCFVLKIANFAVEN